MSKESIIKKVLNEITSTNNGGAGYYVPPIVPGVHKFAKSQLAPFNIETTPFDNQQLAHDYHDGKMSTPKKLHKKLEQKADIGTKYIENNYDFLTLGEWVDVDRIPLNEDLGVWFGTKKKPKGSKQPKGPWVNICRKNKDGKHPPCGRPDTDKGAYPKCRAAGVAGKMSEEQKKAACRQKRNAEKKDTQTGKGQKPIMTSYKPKNETVIRLSESNLIKMIKNIINEQVKQYDYMIMGGDSFNEPNAADKLYLLKNGNSYDVFAQEPNSRRISFTNLTLPLESEMVSTFDGQRFINNDSANLGNQIAKLVSSGLKMSKGNWVVFTKDDGVPAIGRYTLSPNLPIEALEKEGKNRKKLKLNTEFTMNDYFVSDKRNGFGRAFNFDESQDAEPSDV